MKIFLCSVLITATLLLLLPYSILAQTDPFHINETGPRKVQSQDIFLVSGNSVGGINILQKVYRYKIEGAFTPIDSVRVDTMFTKTENRIDNRLAHYEHIDAASGKFNMSPYDNTVSIWTSSSSNKIEILLSNFDTTGIYTNPTVDSLVVAGGVSSYNSEIYVRTGSFDSDNFDEFVIAYVSNQSDSIVLNLYDVDSCLHITQINRFANNKVSNSGSLVKTKYLLENADLNGDGKEELILFTWENPIGSNIPITVRIYALENSNIISKGSTIIQVPNPGDILYDFMMRADKGKFDNDAGYELLFSSHVIWENPINNYNWGTSNYIIDVSQDLQTISIGPRYNINYSSATSLYWLFDAAAGDLNVDKRDEAVIVADGYCRIYTINSDYSLQYRSEISIQSGGLHEPWRSNNFLKLCDINMDTKKDIIIVRYKEVVPDIGFNVFAYTCTDNTLQQAPKEFARLKGDLINIGNQANYAIAVGNFDGFDFTVGTPTLHHGYGVVQPIVLLNAPPVHFDVLNGTTFDINGCYNGGNCDFWSKYKKQSISSIEVATTVHKDWDVSAGLKSDGSVTVGFLGSGVTTNYKAWAIGNYGEDFSKDTSSTSTISISVEVQASDDDRIYSTMTDYDIWEYPVFHGNDTISRRSYFALEPKNIRSTWYGSKSYFAQSYIPDHEVGNILSYYPYDTLSNNPNLSEVIRANYVSDRFSLDGSSSYTWNLNFTDFQQSGASTEKNLGFDAGLEMGGIATNYKFSSNKMSTHKTSVTNIVDLQVHLGSVNMGIGDVKYAVTPYAYWETNGALVIDYAVQPEMSSPGFPPTWWQNNYGVLPDLSFALPWRLDPEKGFTLEEPAKRFQTKDITFVPRKPSVGDTLTITARIRNFSFKATSSPVSVSFYINDPDSGGTNLIGLNGTNSVTTNSVIGTQGKSDIIFKCIVPNGLPGYPRIYAVIDRANNIDEIHENNNKGFNVLGAAPVTGINDDYNIIPDKYLLYQSFPNPFNPSATIRYSVPVADIVKIKVYDILGKEISTLVNEYQTPGTYNVEFNCGNFSSGIYFYRMQSGNFVDVKKMILIK